MKITLKLRTVFFLLLTLPVYAIAQRDSVLSGAYQWKQPIKKGNKIASVVLLEGTVHDFDWMEVTGNKLDGNKKIKQNVSPDYEELIIIKSGTGLITFNDSSYTLTPRSVAVLMPGQRYTLAKGSNDALEFYSMKYRSKNKIQKDRNNRSFVKIWENIPFVANSRGGGRRDFFEQATPMQRRFEMHVTTLKEGLSSHDPHTHRAEEIVLMVAGDTEMQVGNSIVKTSPFGFYYLGSNVLHAIKNIGTTPSTYFAFQFE